MWSQTKVTELLGIDIPIIQAGMAGGVTTDKLVSAVSNTGALGTLGAGYMSSDEIRQSIDNINANTSRPFAVNLFAPLPIDDTDTAAIQQMNAKLNEYRARFGIPQDPTVDKYAEPFEAQMNAVLESDARIVGFTFGFPGDDWIERLKDRGIKLIGTATTVDEAVVLEQHGFDLIVAQGSEAGGHRGSFLEGALSSMVGTMALVPQVIDAVAVPVIASGGIMDGRGIVASFALGASAVQLGTAFLTCAESGAHPKYKQKVLESPEHRSVLTRSFSGKPARGIRNEFIEDMAEYSGNTPPYPIQNALTRDIRKAAAVSDNPEYMSLWVGQGTRMSRLTTVADLVKALTEETDRTLMRLSSPQ